MTSIYLINHTPSITLSGVTPYERLYSCAPSYGHFRTFGYVCFVLLPSVKQTKLSPRSRMCIFLGYSFEYKGYRCYDLTSRHLRVSRHVTFLEYTPYFSSPTPDLSFLQSPPVLSPLYPSVVFLGSPTSAPSVSPLAVSVFAVVFRL